MTNSLFFQYASLTIILAIMMATSAIEYVIVKINFEKYRYDGQVTMDSYTRESFYRRASSWAFWGVLLSVILAISYDYFPFLQQAGKNTLFLPLAFICVWGQNHMLGSVSLNIPGSVKEYDHALTLAILNAVREHSIQKRTVTSAQIYKDVKKSFDYPFIGRTTKAIFNTAKLVFRSISKISTVLNGMEMSLSKIQSILEDLKNKKYFDIKQGGNYFLSEDEYYRWKDQNKR